MVQWTGLFILTLQLVQRKNLESRIQMAIHECSLQKIKTKMEGDPLILHREDERTWLNVKTERDSPT